MRAYLLLIQIIILITDKTPLFVCMAVLTIIGVVMIMIMMIIDVCLWLVYNDLKTTNYQILSYSGI